MIKRLDFYSKLFFQIGVAATAVLMPLDILTQGSLRVEWVVFILLMQRPLFFWLAESKKAKSLKVLFISSLPFALPALAFCLTSASAVERSIAVTFSVMMVALLGRTWVFAQFMERETLELFEKTTLIVSGIVVAIGFWQFFGDIIGVPPSYTLIIPAYRAHTVFPFPRVHSLAQEPLFLCNYLFLPIAILITRLRTKLPKKIARNYGIFLVLTASLFLSTNSRTALLGLLVALGIYVIMLRRERNYLWRLTKLGALAAVLGVVMIFSVNVLPRFNAPSGDHKNSLSVFGSRVANLGDDSAKTRYELWPVAINIFKDHPLVGIGPNNARPFIHKEDFQSGSNYRKLQPINNDFLTIPAEMGLIGIFSFVPLAVLLIKRSWFVIRNKYMNPAAAYVIVLIAVAIQANGFGAMALLRTWVIIGVLIAASKFKPTPATKKS